MIVLFVKCTQALCVNDYDWECPVFICLSIKDLFPNPKALGAWVNSWPNSKTSNLFRLLPCSPHE